MPVSFKNDLKQLKPVEGLHLRIEHVNVSGSTGLNAL